MLDLKGWTGALILIVVIAIGVGVYFWVSKKVTVT